MWWKVSRDAVSDEFVFDEFFLIFGRDIDGRKRGVYLWVSGGGVNGIGGRLRGRLKRYGPMG